MAAKKNAGATGQRKTECPISRKHFEEHGPAASGAIRQKLGELPIDAKTFSTGSFGFGSSDKMTVMIGGIPVKCQVSLNITVIGSKELPVAEAA